MRLRARVSDHVALPVESRNEHRTVVLIATWLVGREQRRLTTLRCHISQPFTEATVTEFVGTAEELNGIIGTERSNARLHGPIVLIAKRENVRPHVASLAFVYMSYQCNRLVTRRGEGDLSRIIISIRDALQARPDRGDYAPKNCSISS